MLITCPCCGREFMILVAAVATAGDEAVYVPVPEEEMNADGYPARHVEDE